jgi:hydroxypyruvate isomerase
LNRRQFTGAALATACTVAHSAYTSASCTTVRSSVPFKLSVMLWTVHKELPFDQRMEKVAEAGYGALELVDEFNSWSEADFKKVAARRRAMGLTFDAVAAVKKGVADPSGIDVYVSYLEEFLNTAEKLETAGVIVLSGNRIEGVSGAAQHQACVETLKRAGDLAAKRNMTLLFENIDPEENPRYYLTSVTEGFEIVRKVDNPHVRLLYDFYHEQISEGNLIKKLQENVDLVGLVHIADVPGRHEPGTGEINYASIFRKLAELNYGRFAAMEFIPSGDPVPALRAARELAVRSGRPDST